MVRITLILASSACLVAAVFAHVSQLEGRLLRADPNSIPANPALRAFARGRGEAIYVSRCASCHGVSGSGDPKRGIPDLRDDDWLYGVGTVSDIEQVVKYGIRSHHPKAWNLAIMPAYATPRPSARDEKLAALSPANIRDLVEFLIFQQSINAKVAVTSSDKVAIAPATASAVARGAALFANVGGCYDCHAADAKGDAAIGAPNLIDRVTLYGDGSQDSLTASISYGRAGVCPAWDTRISSAGIRELSVYVYSLSQPEARN